ncbi:NADH-quinone oxidoreductase subunit NuoG [Aquihabitans sp. G128]|uniref:NADH-quinone oxidoreductase subunit NuoG n=1 Tax=Aquihabitans sp. G128 TaxID=2849779 RepID=UPI001C2177B7|nr:NADH-quinone oxidoreductase subunit NuoG [Aquihabitans sp. G128]QXC60169.1 NADH-quinone oxidoreductase subunit NuoG [Aquihabitans sp. G128]
MPDATTETAVAITVNGKAIEARQGELVIDAAERNGVYIPRFCYHHRMEPVGMCRMCLVEVDTGRGPALQPSCMLTVAPDMVVETESPVAKKAQDGILEFLLINHPLDCPVCDKGGECPLQDHTVSFGPGESRFVEEKRHYEKPISISENVYLDRERCILCDRCTRFAKDVAGDTLIHFQDRGNGTQVNTFPDHPFASYFSGNTVQICPVGALTAKPYRFKARPWDLDVVESTCQGCSVGCRIVIDGSRNEVLRYVGVDSDPVNWSWLCDKGRFGFEAVGSEDRLSAPLVRNEAGELGEVRWADALAQVAKAVKAGLDKHGPTGTAIIGGARLTNESAYAWAKLAKAVIGTDNVDAQLGDGLPADVVASLPRATIDEACTAGGTILVIGSDPKDELAVLFLRIRDAVTRHGAKVVELAPRTTSLSELAAHSLRSTPGAVNELVDQLIAGEGDHAAVRELLGAEHLTVLLGRGSLAEAPDATVAAAAALLAAFPNVRFLSGLRRGNVHGALDLGLTPGLLPGRVTLADGADWFTEAWGSVPAEVGLETGEILAAAADGKIDTLILLGADPLSDFPDRELAKRGLEGARTVVAVDTFLNRSSATADVVLPAAGPAEVDGTTTNLEGRVSSVRQKVTPPGTARPDWMIAAELAFRLGADLGFTDAVEVWAEIERVSPAHAGITVEALDAEPDGLLVGRSTPEPADDGGVTAAESDNAAEPEASEHAAAADAADTDEAVQAHEAAAAGAEAATADGTDADADGEGEGAAPEPEEPATPGRPATVAFEAPSYAAPAVDAYSLRLVTARRLYDHGTLVSKAPSLAGLAVPGVLVANPADLERLGVAAGDSVKVSSPRGSLTTPVEPDATVPAGTVVLSWAQGDPSPTVLIDAGAAVTEVRVETNR